MFYYFTEENNNNKNFEKIENVEIDLPKNDVNNLEQTQPSLTKDEPKYVVLHCSLKFKILIQL